MTVSSGFITAHCLLPRRISQHKKKMNGENDDTDGNFSDETTFASLMKDSQNKNKESSIHDGSKKIRKEWYHTDNNRRPKFRGGIPVVDKLPEDREPNECYALNNQPLDTQTYNGPILAPHQALRYDAFIPTGETYDFLPCAPFSARANVILGFKRYYGKDTIMKRYGDFMQGPGDFKPYKLLLYRGRFRAHPLIDDQHRFVYLAPSKPESGQQVGDCFIRLEEIHNRMNGDSGDYEKDYVLHMQYRKIRNAIATSSKKGLKLVLERKFANLQNKMGGLLRFRCWTVAGAPSTEDENRLSTKLFGAMSYIPEDDCVELFRIWAEILRRSQGDKLAAKDFFGRYWDAIIPPEIQGIFAVGFRIIVGSNYTDSRNCPAANLLTTEERELLKTEVLGVVQRVVDTTRLKFRPQLNEDNIFIDDEFTVNATNGAAEWSAVGWRYLDTHPAGLYSIAVDLPVRQFLRYAIDGKPFWQEGYNAPPQQASVLLHGRLNKCQQTQQTTTEVSKLSMEGARNRPRNPTQDKCVAVGGYSANLALSDLYPDYYPTADDAKKRRVAEWLHRSAFSYGGLIPGEPDSSQVANNLVLGTPDTNTVMMRYEAFVKRLAEYGNNNQGCTVVVKTHIQYPAVEGWNENWIGAHQYTWLAPELYYSYQNPNSTPAVFSWRCLYPMKRESCMLFQALLDKSFENKCWGWNCWGDNDVGRALLDAMRVADDEEEGPSEEKAFEMVNQDLAQRPEFVG